MPGRLRNVYCHSGRRRQVPRDPAVPQAAAGDEGRQRQAALTAFAAFPELKHVILVDEDVDLFDTNDVLWAMTTRYQGDVSTVFIPGVRCHPLDPSQSPDFSPSIRDAGHLVQDHLRLHGAVSPAGTLPARAVRAGAGRPAAANHLARATRRRAPGDRRST